MSVTGQIQVSLDLTDTYAADAVSALKKITLSSAGSYTAGTAVVVSGTCGTTAVNVDLSEYRGADGELVSWDSWPTSTRIAFVAQPSAALNWDAAMSLRMTSRNSQVAVTSLPLGTVPLSPSALQVKTVAGIGSPYTASYTVVIVKEA